MSYVSSHRPLSIIINILFAYAYAECVARLIFYILMFYTIELFGLK